MKKVLSILLYGSILSAPVFAQQQNYTSADSVALVLKDRHFSSTASLVKQLTNGLDNDFRKVRAIYSWVTGSIQYDMASFNNKTFSIVKPSSEMLTDRKGVCQDYAALVKEMCQEAGIRCEVINGIAKAGPYLGTDLHAWNAVQINNKWYLMDATWGSVYWGISRYDYFLTPPEQLICNHFPDSARWSLLEHTPSREAFSNYPYLSIGYFKVAGNNFPREINLTAHNQSLIIDNYAMKTGNGLHAEIVSEENMKLLEQADDYKSVNIGIRNILNADKKVAQYVLTGIPKGEYWLYLYLQASEEPTDVEGSLPYQLIIFRVESI